MVKCKHGFWVCRDCKLEYHHPTDCHYPGCEDLKTKGQQFCPKHGGTFAAHYVDKTQESDK